MNLYECIGVFGFLSVALLCLTLLGLKQSRLEKEVHNFRIDLIENTRVIGEKLESIFLTLDK